MSLRISRLRLVSFVSVFALAACSGANPETDEPSATAGAELSTSAPSIRLPSTRIAYGALVDITTASRPAARVFAFEGTAGDDVVVSSSEQGASGNPRVYVFDPGGRTIGQTTVGTELRLLLSSSGTFHVFVLGAPEQAQIELSVGLAVTNLSCQTTIRFAPGCSAFPGGPPVSSSGGNIAEPDVPVSLAEPGDGSGTLTISSTGLRMTLGGAFAPYTGPTPALSGTLPTLDRANFAGSGSATIYPNRTARVRASAFYLSGANGCAQSMTTCAGVVKLP